MSLKALFILSLVMLNATQSLAQSRNSVTCNIIDTWYTQDPKTNSVPNFNPVPVIVPLDLKTRVGKLEIPMGDGGEFKVSILATSTNELDCLYIDTFLMKKNHDGTFLPISADKRIGCSGDSFNDKLATIDTQNKLRNIHLEQAKVLYGMDLISPDGVNDLDDETYAGMVKKNLIAPKTLSKIDVNCSILRLKK